jgi:colanic acid biosynthesis glycosyl transferase WcaI
MTAKPSVLLINRVYAPDRRATGRMLRDLARAFAGDGWAVTVLATGAKAGQGKDGDVIVRRVHAKPGAKSLFAYLTAWLRLGFAAWRLPRHDLIVSLSDPPLLVVAASVVARRKKSKHIHWCHDLYPELLPVLGYDAPEGAVRFLAKLSRQAMKKSDRVVVIGRCMARALVHRGLDSRAISVIPNWPDPELALGAMIEAVDAKAASPSPPALFRDPQDMKFRILYAGTLGRAHPVETVLKAAQILQKTNPDIEIVFVGEGALHEKLAAERARRGLENIKFLPWQPASRLRPLIESGDVHLVTMRTDAVGMLVPCKIYSAFAAGRPCILVGPEHSEAGRLLLDFGAGKVVPQGEPEQLASVIRAFREDSDVWFRAEQGARQAGEIFTPEESLRAWIERARIVLGLPVAPLRVQAVEEPAIADLDQAA